MIMILLSFCCCSCVSSQRSRFISEHRARLYINNNNDLYIRTYTYLPYLPCSPRRRVENIRLAFSRNTVSRLAVVRRPGGNIYVVIGLLLWTYHNHRTTFGRDLSLGNRYAHGGYNYCHPKRIDNTRASVTSVIVVVVVVVG